MTAVMVIKIVTRTINFQEDCGEVIIINKIKTKTKKVKDRLEIIISNNNNKSKEMVKI